MLIGRTEVVQQELASARTRLVAVEQELSAARQAIQQEAVSRTEMKDALAKSTEANAQSREKLAETRTKLEERDAQLRTATEQINELQQERTVSPRTSRRRLPRDDTDEMAFLFVLIATREARGGSAEGTSAEELVRAHDVVRECDAGPASYAVDSADRLLMASFYSGGDCQASA